MQGSDNILPRGFRPFFSSITNIEIVFIKLSPNINHKVYKHPPYILKSAKRGVNSGSDNKY